MCFMCHLQCVCLCLRSLNYCPCLISDRASMGSYVLKDSSCCCGVSPSGFALEPFLSKNEAVREQKKKKKKV